MSADDERRGDGERLSPGDERRLLVRLRDRSGALERTIGLVRRRAFAVRRLSVAGADDGVLELVLRVDGREADVDRLRDELLGLVDVLEVDPVAGGAGETRELLIARVPGEPPELPAAPGRVTRDVSGGTVIELAGRPDELDAVVARLRESGVPFRATRSGEVAMPREAGPASSAAPASGASTPAVDSPRAGRAPRASRRRPSPPKPSAGEPSPETEPRSNQENS